MKTSTIIGLLAFGFFGAAAYLHEPAVAAIGAVGWFLAMQLHALEVKINKLLDERGIVVSQHEIRS